MKMRPNSKDEVIQENHSGDVSNSAEAGASLLAYALAVAILLTGALLYVQSLEDAFEENYEQRRTEHDFTQKEPLIVPSP